jgi:two-component system, OmpR family, response regulator
VLRRSQVSGDLQSGVLTFEDLVLDDDMHEVTRNGVIIELTPTEFSLLRFLMANPRRALPKSQILLNVWKYDFDGDGTVVETYISYLRKKLDMADRPSLIQTVRGVGYALRLSRATDTS